MTYLHAKVQGQRSVGSEDRVETNADRRTDGRTNGGDCITSYANVVGKIERKQTEGNDRLLYLPLNTVSKYYRRPPVHG